MSTAHGVARLFARRRGAGERLKARQVEQKKPVRYIMDTSKVWGISILAGLDLAWGCGKQLGTCHFQSGPDKSPVRSNTIPDFRDITVDFVTVYLWALYCPDSRTWLAQANSLILRRGLS